jgi:hypothetical protein
VTARARTGTVVALGVVAGSLVGFGIGAAGCSYDTDLSATLPVDAAAGPEADAPRGDAGPLITVTSLAPALTSAPPVKASATWAAYRLDEGDWRVISPSAPGTYSFPVAVARWSLALVCASDDSALSTVYVHHRTNATPDVEVTLDASCTKPPPAAEFAFTGRLTNIPATTQWFDFGYARDSRGEAIPVSGTTGTYEVVGIEPGTWDIAFGIRDEPFKAITRFVMRRGEVVKSDETIDVDVTGPGSFAPGTKPIRLHGLVRGDTVTPSIFYAAGGPLGIDVGPQDVPDGQPDVSLVYSTVPAASQIAGDRYRGELSAIQDRRTGGRTITFDIHEPIDLDMTFLPEPPEPTVRVLGVSPHARFETRFPVVAGAERHEIEALAMLNRRTQHAFRSTYDAIYVASAMELVDTTPDLSSLPGWKPEWGLPSAIPTSVLATAYEKSHPLGDGKMQRATSKGVTVTP